jgi:hypothetical protein
MTKGENRQKYLVGLRRFPRRAKQRGLVNQAWR